MTCATRSRRRRADLRRVGVLTAIWCALFAIPHVYWALGGRGGLGGEAGHADQAFRQPWFAAYNALVIVACGVGVGIATAVARSGVGAPTSRRRLARTVCRLTAAVLALRGAVGLIGLVWTLMHGAPLPPPVLLWVEPAFVIGGMLWWRLGGALVAPTPGSAPGPGPGPAGE